MIDKKTVQWVTVIAGILTILYTGFKFYDEYLKKDKEPKIA